MSKNRDKTCNISIIGISSDSVGKNPITTKSNPFKKKNNKTTPSNNKWGFWIMSKTKSPSPKRELGEHIGKNPVRKDKNPFKKDKKTVPDKWH